MNKKEFLHVAIDENTTVYVETTVLGGEEDVSLKAFAFDKVADTIAAMSKRFASVFKAAEPDKAKVEFGIELATECGELAALIVGAKGTATFTVSLEWGSNEDNGAQSKGR